MASWWSYETGRRQGGTATASLTQLAIDASEDAFKDGVKTAIRELMNGLILAKTDEEVEACVVRHESVLKFHRMLHERSMRAIESAFT